ncbi:glycosyltransferase [Aequorivita todarodis]|uniref:glycosyltransferase n=1 Tax=Aequorivita todarodis TaxID=2036821 RepID=UPI00234FEA7F|nr:glycosyltransferase [Aequorivita todarodis]MDC8000066.1 glycosyltransferase [Aequorivita todarodis]
MKTPLISIIVPCYNVEKYIDKSFESIKNQSYGNWECIAVNDGSTDNTERKIKQWTQREPRFRLISQENTGPSGARNAGLKDASGDCIFFFDSDDLLDADCLNSLVSLYQPSIDIVIGKNAEVLNQTTDIIKTLEHYPITDKVLSDQDFLELSLRSPISVVAWNKLYSREFIDSNSLTFKDGIIHEDELWFFEIMHLAKKIIFNSKVTYYYNIGNQNSITKTYNLNNLDNYLQVVAHIFTDHYATERNDKKKLMVGTYILNQQIMIISGFFRFLKKNKVPYKAEGVSLIKKHLQRYPINDFFHLSDKKSKLYQIFIKYGKVNPETAFKLMRNTDKRNILKFFENIFLKYQSRNAIKNL